jgi:hypothetical protein
MRAWTCSRPTALPGRLEPALQPEGEAQGGRRGTVEKRSEAWRRLESCPQVFPCP